MHALPSVVAVVGLGNMGRPMAANLLRSAAGAGAAVLLHGRTRGAVEDLIASGARWVDDAGELAGATVILSMLPDLPQLEPMVFGPDGMAASVKRPTVLLVGSTSSPAGVRDLGERALSDSGGLLHVMDSPVSGGTEGAQAGTLSIMVGGEPDDFAVAQSVLAAMGAPVLLGPLGSGQIAKACNQAIVAATVLALGEAAVLADRCGLDVGAMFDVLGRGYAGSRILETRGRRIVERNYSVAGPAKYMIKDLGFALDEAARTQTRLPQTECLRDAFTDLGDRGFGDSDISVTRAYVESLEF